jgi:hypothetical protein
VLVYLLCRSMALFNLFPLKHNSNWRNYMWHGLQPSLQKNIKWIQRYSHHFLFLLFMPSFHNNYLYILEIVIFLRIAVLYLCILSLKLILLKYSCAIWRPVLLKLHTIILCFHVIMPLKAYYHTINHMTHHILNLHYFILE